DAVKKESRHQTYTEVFGESLVEIADQDDRIVAITSAMCDGTGLAEFRKKYGGRFYDVGIAESTAVDIAAGLAKTGLKPVVCIYSTFLQRSFDQIISEVALQNLPVVFCIDRAGVVGSDGPTHHGLMDIGFLRMMPNMVLVAPANGVEMKLALEFALEQNRPVAIRYPKDLVPNPETVRAACKKPFKLGKSVTVKRSKGSSIAVVSYGSLLEECLEASNLLSKEGIAIDVINARFAGPIDPKILSLLHQGKSIITVEDHRSACGFGSTVLEEAARIGAGDSNRIAILGMPKEFIRHSSRQSQLVDSGVSVEGIIKTAREMHKTITK
ncbi:MAG: transketolase C-terminal domain-containing protein, partial [Planctomycetota bacterium]